MSQHQEANESHPIFHLGCSLSHGGDGAEELTLSHRLTRPRIKTNTLRLLRQQPPGDRGPGPQTRQRQVTLIVPGLVKGLLTLRKKEQVMEPFREKDQGKPSVDETALLLVPVGQVNHAVAHEAPARVTLGESHPHGPHDPHVHKHSIRRATIFIK